MKSKEEKILIVDDSMTQAVQFQLLLEEEGYITALAGNGVEAMEYLDKNCQHLPDLILSDINMPEMDGFELCTTVKKRYSDIPVILITAQNNEEVIARSFKLGAIDYLPKTFSVIELLSRVNNVLNIKKIFVHDKNYNNEL